MLPNRCMKPPCRRSDRTNAATAGAAGGVRGAHREGVGGVADEPADDVPPAAGRRRRGGADVDPGAERLTTVAHEDPVAGRPDRRCQRSSASYALAAEAAAHTARQARAARRRNTARRLTKKHAAWRRWRLCRVTGDSRWRGDQAPVKRCFLDDGTPRTPPHSAAVAADCGVDVGAARPSVPDRFAACRRDR